MDGSYLVTGLNPGTGLQVEMTLVAASEADARAQAEATGLREVRVTAVAGASSAEAAPTGPAKEPPLVLIVDDHEDTRYVLARLLMHDGYRTAMVEGPAEAMAYLDGGRPDLIILDFRMPGMNGLTLFGEIRKNPDLAHIPVIMFSADSARVREEALQAGIDAYVVKDSMDWALLHREVVRLAGPGTGEKSVPDVSPPRIRDAS